MSQILSLEQYAISIGPIAEPLTAFLQDHAYSQYFILVDENTHRDCLTYFLEQIPILQKAKLIQIKSGEINKNLTSSQDIWTSLIKKQADRNSLLINLGGGVIGDMGGFVASTYKRGIDFIQIPTTLLSQVDASIGGKLGIDFMDLKNIIGLFKNPKGVFIDTHFLKSLPFREIRSGYAEILKHALIADANYWKELAKIQDLKTAQWDEIVWASLKIKKAVVEADPFEKGYRKILNFGHTVGHAIESWSLKHDSNPLLHGEAIALGMMVETQLSHIHQGLTLEDREEILEQIMAHYPDYTIEASIIPALIKLMKNDKKNETDLINFTLLSEIGTAVYNVELSTHLIEEVLEILV